MVYKESQFEKDINELKNLRKYIQECESVEKNF